MDQELKKTLWAAADKLRSNMDAAGYKHIVLGLIFLKYVSDASDERRAELHAAFADEANDLYPPDADEHVEALEERDYYPMTNSPFSDSGWRVSVRPAAFLSGRELLDL
jgi:type I restriction enzyme M protein